MFYFGRIVHLISEESILGKSPLNGFSCDLKWALVIGKSSTIYLPLESTIEQTPIMVLKNLKNKGFSYTLPKQQGEQTKSKL
jgi:hypothetical protein